MNRIWILIGSFYLVWLLTITPDCSAQAMTPDGYVGRGNFTFGAGLQALTFKQKTRSGPMLSDEKDIRPRVLLGLLYPTSERFTIGAEFNWWPEESNKIFGVEYDNSKFDAMLLFKFH